MGRSGIVGEYRRDADKAGRLCYSPASPQLDPWCSGPTCQPVTLEIAGSNPVGSAISRISLRPVRPPGRGVLLPVAAVGARSPSGRVQQAPAVLSQSAAMKRLPLLVVLGLIALAIALPMSGGMLGFGEASPTPPGIAAGPSPSAGASGTPPASSEAPASADPGATPEPTPAATPAPTTAPTGRGRGRAGHAIPGHRDQHHARRGGRRARRHEHALRGARPGRRGSGRDPHGRRCEPPGRRRSPGPRPRRGCARQGPREAPQAPGLPARRRGDAGRPGAGLGWPDAVRRGPRHHRGGVAAACPAPGGCRRRGLRSGQDVDDVRRRRHPPGPRRVPDGPDQGQGRRLPVRRRNGRDHRPHLLLGVRLGTARHETDRATAGRCGS